jgi:hypothetical protein
MAVGAKTKNAPSVSNPVVIIRKISIFIVEIVAAFSAT